MYAMESLEFVCITRTTKQFQGYGADDHVGLLDLDELQAHRRAIAHCGRSK